MPKIVLVNTSFAGQEYVFDEEVVVGRSDKAGITLPQPAVSRRHAILKPTDNQWTLVDLESENGTFLNNKRVGEPAVLSDGDQLIFGSVLVEFTQTSEKRGDDSTASVHLIDEEIAHRKVVSTMEAVDRLSRPIFEIIEPPEHFPSESESGIQQGPLTGPDDEIVRTFHERMRFLNELADVLSRSFDEQALLAFVADQLFDLMPAAERTVLLLKSQDGSFEPRLARGRDGEEDNIALSRTLIDEAVASKSGILVSDTLVDERYSKLESIQSMKLRSFVGVPMICQERIYGVIQLDSSRPERPLARADMAFTMAIASQVAMSLAYLDLHKKSLERELLERDMGLARDVQRYFLPEKPPTVNGYSFETAYRPAFAVGGDFYDFRTLPNGKIAIAVGDVSGKGVSAALYVARLSSDLRYHSTTAKDPAELLHLVNHALCGDSRSGMFVTLLLMVLDPANGRVSVANAGHPQAVLRKQDGSLTTIGGKAGFPLGIEEDAVFALERAQVDPGDAVFVYTDGITEAESPERELFGEQRLFASLAPGLDAQQLSQDVLRAVAGFAQGAAQSDDITLVCFSRD